MVQRVCFKGVVVLKQVVAKLEMAYIDAPTGVTTGVYVDVPGMVWKCFHYACIFSADACIVMLNPNKKRRSLTYDQMLAQLCLMFRTGSEGFKQQESSTSM
ncbi:hypothetical protein Tco_0829981, partial [Tanacetum coccineum]